MGKCSTCGKRISYNSYKVIKGIVYCLGCSPITKKSIITSTEKAAEEIKKYGLVGFTDTYKFPKDLPVKKSKRKRKVGKHKKTSTKRGN